MATKVPLINLPNAHPIKSASLSHKTCNKNPLQSIDYSENKCIGFCYSSFFFHSLLSHSILLCFIFPFTLYSLNFSNVCMGFEKLSVYCPCIECRYNNRKQSIFDCVNLGFWLTKGEQVRDKINLAFFFSVCSCRFCIALTP